MAAGQEQSDAGRSSSVCAFASSIATCIHTHNSNSGSAHVGACNALPAACLSLCTKKSMASTGRNASPWERGMRGLISASTCATKQVVFSIRRRLQKHVRGPCQQCLPLSPARVLWHALVPLAMALPQTKLAVPPLSLTVRAVWQAASTTSTDTPSDTKP